MPLYLKTVSDCVETLPVKCRKWVHPHHRPFSSHYHEDVEIIAMLEGTMKCTVDKKTYILNEGDAVLFNSYSAHQGDILSDSATYICLQFVPTSVLNLRDSVLLQCGPDLESEDYAFDEFFPAQTVGNELCDRCKIINENIGKNTPQTEIRVLSELYAVLALLIENHYHKNIDKPARKRSEKFVRNFSAYMSDNYKNPIIAAEVAKALFMSKSYLSHQVQRHFGVSLSKYIRQYRVDRAIQDPLMVNRTVKEMSEAVGFDDVSYFSRAFKEYTGESPAIYFKRRKETHKS